jgi:hypothetical protein
MELIYCKLKKLKHNIIDKRQHINQKRQQHYIGVFITPFPIFDKFVTCSPLSPTKIDYFVKHILYAS